MKKLASLLTDLCPPMVVCNKGKTPVYFLVLLYNRGDESRTWARGQFKHGLAPSNWMGPRPKSSDLKKKVFTEISTVFPAEIK